MKASERLKQAVDTLQLNAMLWVDGAKAWRRLLAAADDATSSREELEAAVREFARIQAQLTAWGHVLATYRQGDDWMPAAREDQARLEEAYFEQLAALVVGVQS
jgi:FtsZ-binding cell division protein ZapB